MHKLFAAFMGVFASIGTFFHGGQPANSQSTNKPAVYGTAASPSGSMRWEKGNKMHIPQGERPFFGTVTAVTGSTLTVTMQRPMMMRSHISITPSITPPEPKTITVTLASSTTYTGGTQSDITTGTKIAGVGTVNTDGSITAVKVSINPTMPSGMPHRYGLRGKGFKNQNQQ